MSGSRQVKGNEVSKSRILKGHTRNLSWVADDTKNIFQAATARCFYNQLHRVKFQVIFCHHFPWVCKAKYYRNCLWWYYLNKGSLPLISISNLRKTRVFFFLHNHNWFVSWGLSVVYFESSTYTFSFSVLFTSKAT